MTSTFRYSSFLVRLWHSAQEGESWQGEVEHIQTGHRYVFSDLTELLNLLQQQTSEMSLLVEGAMPGLGDKVDT